MILSRTLAKSRITRGERPSWLAAWAPVAFDAACLLGLFVLAYRPFQTFVETHDISVGLTATALFLAGFIPVQVVLILSSLWAAKSRFKDETAP